MPKRLSPLYKLTGNQAAASSPEELAWVSASAGTGKTQVLTARVMRLLLHGVDPASILCLTFTKAGAAEMANRIHDRLAHWVRLKGPLLAGELRNLGEGHDPVSVERARQLFARVLDARGGGLRIQTIHAFAQSLLAAFPAEAGLVPGFRPIEGREEALLARETLAAMLIDAEERNDVRLIDDVQALSRRMGEGGAEAFLIRCAGRPEALEALHPPELIEDMLREAFGVPLGDIDEKLAQWCADTHFDIGALRRVAAANTMWSTKTGLANAAFIDDWLAKDPSAEGRVAALGELRNVWAKKDGDLRSFSSKLLEAEPDYAALASGLDEAVSSLLAMRVLANFAAFAAAGLRAGSQFAQDYALAKRRIGALDFNDLIRLTGKLLDTEGMGDWVRYKLDASIDHVLVDEAQDTNAQQWTIVEKLAEEFFETDPDNPDAPLRTIFAVGDFKQAIFGFQGTDPAQFDAARERFSRHIAERGRALTEMSLDESYRSSPPVLELVDNVMTDIGADDLGLQEALRAHASAKAETPGRVTLLRPVTGDADIDEAEERWLADASLDLARRLAKQVKAWIGEIWLADRGRMLRPEDVLILLRSRGELASLIVARLHEEGVPVAGVDRLTLTEPLAIQDLLAALRFALQPHDDLNLASLLVSPLLGWTQEQLYKLAFERKSTLWSALRDGEADHPETLAGLGQILNQADLVTPYQLLESILSGSLGGRRKLLSRLGEEARDPIEELLNAALQFEADNPPSLQHFIDWFDSGSSEIKRDSEAPLDAVRVMTVHGAKGLQAPMVILADATFDPTRQPPGGLDLAPGEGRGIPLPRPRRAEQLGTLGYAIEAQKAKERQEHWRLLYVALTRAEEHLVVGGALGVRSKGEPPGESWYAAVARSMESLAGDWDDDGLWGGVRQFSGTTPIEAKRRRSSKQHTAVRTIAAPDWLHLKAPDEERPPRPLAPSALGPDAAADPPPSREMRAAAERGKLLHRLFERLPEIDPDRRRDAALGWLRDAAGIKDADLCAALVADALRVIENPDFSDIFGPDALAEAPIAAIVDDVVISGTVDRLLIGEGRVRVIDFKSSRIVPQRPEDVPKAHVRQMAAYGAALQTIFPNSAVDAALLYTGGPVLLSLPEALLDENKPRFADMQESLSPLG